MLVIVSALMGTVNVCAKENSPYDQSRVLLKSYLENAKGCYVSQQRRMDVGYYDCSSLVYRAYRAADIEIPTTTATQIQWGREKDILTAYNGYVDGEPSIGTIIFFSRSADPKDVFCEGIVFEKGSIIFAGKEKVETRSLEEIGEGYCFVMNPLETLGFADF